MAKKRNWLSGKRIAPEGIAPGLTVKQLIDQSFLAYNGARLKEACNVFTQKMLQPDVTIGMSISGALTPAGLGCSCYVPLIERKPGALRNGAPFADLPEPLQRMRKGLLHQEGGDRVMAQVLAEVPKQGLDAVLVAVELALESAPPSGRVSTEHVINVLGRLQAQPLPETVATNLQVSQTPLADTARYDSLRAGSDMQEADHA